MRQKRKWHALMAIPLICLPVLAQEEDEEQVFELSPFVVDESSDIGYLAQNTLSGGRFNVNLGDTAASVSVFTQEFIEDFGIQDVDELARYTLGTVLDTGDADASTNINQVVSAFRTVGAIRIRGLQATKGRNFYQAITPDDGYRNGRYDESRGPNGILFGISNAGGMVSSSTMQGNVYKDSLRLRYTTGDYGENRSEFQANKVLIEDKLGVAVAGLYEDSEGWRDWMQDDRKRIYGALTYQHSDRLTIRAMGEIGKDYRVFFRPSPIVDTVSLWLDSGRPLAVPYGENPPSELRDIGIGRFFNNIRQTRANRVGQDPRMVYIENLGELHNLSSTYTTAGYEIFIDQIPGKDGNVGALRLNKPELIPYDSAFNGPDVGRETNMDWYQIEADVKLSENMFLNIGYNDQFVEVEASYTAGNDPGLAGDPNITLGLTSPNVLGHAEDRNLEEPDQDLINQNLNPFAGGLYLEADHNYQIRSADSKEARVSLSYTLDTDSWLGNHRMAVAVSNRKVVDKQRAMRMAFLGAPYNNNPLDNDNKILSRTYIDLDDRSTWAYRQTLLEYDPESTATLVINDFANPSAVGTGIPSDGVEREIGWVAEDGFTNSRTDQDVDAFVFVSQSRFLNDRLVVTLGYREDKAFVEEYAVFDEPGDFGYVLNESEVANETEFIGESKAIGGVFHLTENFSLVANYATSIGLPSFNRAVLPENAREDSSFTTIPPPPDGEGTDFGIAFKFLDNKISGRIVYYTTESTNESTGGTFGNIVANNNRNILSYLEGILVPDNYSESEWQGLENKLNTRADAAIQDSESDGWEFRLVANITRNWRVSLNASYTDRVASNFYKRGIPWMGLTYDENGLLAPYFTSRPKTDDDPDEFGASIITYDKPEALNPDGTIATILDLTAEASAITGEDELNLDGTAEGGRSIGEVLVDRQWYRLNSRVRDANKRWSLRPYKANIQTGYDFKEGFLEDVSIGGGVRWQSANIIGGDDEQGIEWKGEDYFETDFFLRYRQRLGRGKGTITYQLNIYNVLDDQSIIPQRLATYPDQEVPDGSGRIAYTRFDLRDPRTFRFSVTYQY